MKSQPFEAELARLADEYGAGLPREARRCKVNQEVGRPGQQGTGAIPKDAIAELVSARGTIRVHHVSGGVSIIGLKTYASGREKFQDETLDYVWLDEEPPADIYTEALTRTNVGASPVAHVHAAAGRLDGRKAFPARAITRPPQGGDGDQRRWALQRR